MKSRFLLFLALKLILLGIFILLIEGSGTARVDSIGFRTIDNQSFIIHEVERGETLYKISRDYGVSISKITNSNPGINPDRISIGEHLLIPAPQLEIIAAEHLNVSSTAPDIEEGQHLIQKGETLYKISRMYQVAVAELVDWNMLSDDELQEGQILTIKRPDGFVSQASTAEIQVETHASEAMLYKGPVNENDLSLKYKSNLASEYYSESLQKGVITWMDNHNYPPSQGYFALHKTLPVGTIIRVTNTINGQEVYAKVIGTLPENEENTNILVKLPTTARNELRIPDERLLVKVNYLEKNEEYSSDE